MSAASAIRAKIAKTERERLAFKAMGDGIFAAACAIRIVALKEALQEVEKEKRQ